MRALSLVLLLALLAIGAGGCRKIASLVGVGAKKETSSDPNKSSAAIEAMSQYAKGFNALIDRPQGMIKTYFSTVPEAGPEDGKKYQLAPDHAFAEPKLAEAKQSFTAAAKVAPASLKHIEPLATTCVGDLERILSVYKSAHGYYQAEDFKDDKGERGKKLHGELVKLAETFRTDIDKLESALTEIENQQADEELKQFADKKTYSHQFRFFNRQASRLINAKPEAFGPAFGAVESAHAGLSEFTKTPAALQPVFKAYADAADRFFSDAKRLKRELDAKAKEEDLDAIRESLTSNYNALVGVSNSLRDLEANGLLK